MSRALSVNSKITLRSGSTETEFTVERVPGEGGSCVAYEVSFREDGNIVHRGILKEYCPKYLDRDDSFSRDGTSIVVPDEHRQLFDSELQRFRDTYRIINDYLASNMSAVNYHPVQLGLYEGNNTLYTLTSCDYGESYDRIPDKDISSVLRLMLSVTKAVEQYHEAGFLHLDIKPRNILILDDVTDLVKLFDYDSLTPIEGLRSGSVSAIPVPETYYVPELASFEIRNIGIHTDIFEIGAMLFCRIFDRAPTHEEMNRNVRYDFDSARILDGISPQAKHELDTLLRHTVQTSSRSRYRTTEELKTQLTKLISLISENAPYLINLPRWQPALNTVGRQDEIQEIRRRLDSDGYVFVRGIGGLGKSEIAKMYAKKYADSYHTVQFCKYTDSLSTLVAAMPVNGINDSDYSNPDDLVKEKLKVLHGSDSGTLIIVDNFNTTHDRMLREFLPTGKSSFRVIFTTRCVPAADYYHDRVFELPPLSAEECTRLFCQKSSLEENSETREYILKITEAVRSNTLILVLLAGTVKKTRMSLSEVIETLENQELAEIKSAVFHEYDYTEEDMEEYNRIYSHLNTIFNVSRLSDSENIILKNMSLISPNGISLQEFIAGCASSAVTAEAARGLASQGWIELDDSGKASLHPIISDLIADNSTPKNESYYSLFTALEEFCDEEKSSHFLYTMERFACALQLDRRSRGEDGDIRFIAKVRLGNLYKEIYRPKDARKCIAAAFEMLEQEGDSENTAYLYRMQGDIEAGFGTPDKAIENYQLAVEGSFALEDYELLVGASAEIADCYSDNKEYTRAYDAYNTAIDYAEEYEQYEYIPHLAKELAEICTELGRYDEAEELKKLAEGYIEALRKRDGIDTDDKSEEDEDELSVDDEVAEILQKVNYENPAAAVQILEQLCDTLRERYGEDSPDYKEAVSSSWHIYALNGDKEKVMRIISEDLVFVESTYGADSLRMADRLSEIAMMLPNYFSSELQYAIDCANRSIEICEAKGYLHTYAYCKATLALSVCILSLGLKDDARFLIDSIDFTEFSGTDFIFDIIRTAGFTMYELSRYDVLESLCTEMLTRTHTYRTHFFLPNILLSWIYMDKGKLSESSKCLDQAYECAAELGKTPAKLFDLDIYWRSVAKLDYYKKDYKAAIESISIAMETFTVMQEYSYYKYAFFLERGLYFISDGQIEKAKADYAFCEKILDENNLPKEAYLTLYNNIAGNFAAQKDFKSAVEYCNKILTIRPKIMNPEIRFDALVCANIGWSIANLGNHGQGLRMTRAAIDTFERIGAADSYEMYTAKRNLTMIYDMMGEKQKAIDLNLILYEQCDHPDFPNKAFQKTIVATDLIIAYIETDRAGTAYEFAHDAEQRFSELFGECSEERIELLLRAGDIFKGNGFTDCINFFALADQAIQKGSLEETMYNARVLNYIGGYLADAKEDYGYARDYFVRSKELYEKLGQKDDPTYQIVLNNIDYVDEKLHDSLMDELVAMYMNRPNSGEEE